MKLTQIKTKVIYLMKLRMVYKHDKKIVKSHKSIDLETINAAQAQL